MGFQEHIDEGRISSFTISQNGKATFKKSYRKKNIVIIIMTMIAVCFASMFVYYSYMKTTYTICNTKSCLKSTVSLINSMNESVDPCEDFYEFACGMFENNYGSYYSSQENSWTTMISSKINYIVKKFLDQENKEYEPLAVHKTRQFYNTCLEYTADDILTNYDFLRNTSKELGLDENYLNESFPLEVEKMSARVKVYLNRGIFFDVYPTYDPRNTSSHFILYINPVSLQQNFKKNLMNTTAEEYLPQFIQYFNVVIDRLLNQNQTKHKDIFSDDLTNTTEELVTFNENFLKISQNESNMMDIDPIPTIITLGNLQNITDSIGDVTNFYFNWTLYLSELFRDVDSNAYQQLLLTSENINDYELLISSTDYIYNLFKLLSETQTKILKMAILTNTAIHLENDFSTVKNEESQYCFLKTINTFGMATGYSLVNTLDNSTKSALTEMNDDIIWALRKMINAVDWMDNETKNYTLRKLANTKTNIGYPDNYASTIDYFYQNLSLTNNHIDNLILISKFEVKREWKQLTENLDRKNIQWLIGPGEVNAYNDFPINTFFMPVAILQYPLYYNGIQALNYGITGFTIGHELSHSYDNTGRLYNDQGNKEQWWTKKSIDEYTKRTNCLVKYYDNIEITTNKNKFRVNGIKTLDENIADIAGLKEAYFAYQHYVDKHGQEPRLIGMEKYNQEQLFFIGYANQFCQYITTEDDTDTHSPFKVRVKGVLSLSQEFAKTWSCPLGSPMNPIKDCNYQIW